ncbi:RICIN domain-containing protein [Spirosoma arcticum]
MLYRLLLLTLLTQFTYGRMALAQIAIFNATNSALPNQAVSLQGNFGANVRAFMLAGSSTSPTPLAVLAQSADHVSVKIPSNVTHDLYQIWVEDQGQRSNTVFVNQALAMHPDSPLISPGGPLRIFGRNLKLTAGTPQIRLVAQNGGPTLEVGVDLNQSDAYKLSLTMPTNLQPGVTYDLQVNNGQGGPAGQTRMPQTLTAVAAGQDYFQLGVGWAAKLDFYRNVYNVKTDSRLSKKAIGDGNANDQPAIQEAINRAHADGGGIVYLPAGTYSLYEQYFEFIQMRNRVVVQGAGKDQTILKFGYRLNVDHVGVHFPTATNLSGLADLSLLNIDNTGSASMGNLRGGRVSEVFFQRIRFDLNRGDWMDLANSDKLVIANSDFTQGVSEKSNYRGPINLTACTNFVIARNSFTFAVHGLDVNYAREGVFENNRVYRDGSARYPGNLINHVLILNFTQNIAVLNNLFKVINGPTRNNNDGETIFAEGGGNSSDRVDEDAGTVSGATATTLQDNSKNWGNLRHRPVVAIVSGKGMGQWRSIVSRNGNTLNLDRAWDVVPERGCNYAIFNWGARNWLVQGNTLEGNVQGIMLYHNATTQVAIANNTLTNSGSIELAPIQQEYNGYQQFTPMYNNQIVGNSVANTDRSGEVFIGVHTVQHGQERTFGTSVIGLDVRNNRLSAGRPAVRAVMNDSYHPEGYLNYLEYHQRGVYVDERIPAVLGSIFENNTATNCDNGLYLNSGSYNTVVCNLELVNTPNAVKDTPLDKIDHWSVGTGSCNPMAPSSPNSPVESGAIYTITAKHSSKVLDVYGSSREDGGKIVQWGPNGADNQKWILTDLKNGYYVIKSSLNGKALDVSGSSMSDGAQIYQWSTQLGDNQQFKLVDAGGGYYNVVAKHSQKYLTIERNSPSDGAYIQQWSNNGGDNQKFRFTKLIAPSETSQPIAANVTYTITAKHSSKALDVYGSSREDGGKIVQWGPNGADNQKWILTDQKNGYYLIKSSLNGKALDVGGSSMSDGAQVFQWSIHLGDNQQFKLVDAGGGYYNVVAKHSQKYLTIERNSPSDGAYLQQWSNNNGDNQKFRFTKLNGSTGNLLGEGDLASVRVYPNPASDVVRVEGVAGSEVSVVDMLGRVCTIVVSREDNCQLDVSALASGLYLLQIKKAGSVTNRKLVVTH